MKNVFLERTFSKRDCFVAFSFSASKLVMVQWYWRWWWATCEECEEEVDRIIRLFDPIVGV